MKNKKDIHELDPNMRISSIGEFSYKWYGPLNISEMRVSGFCWIEKDKVYRRNAGMFSG
jgi:hypothetical protein